MTAERVMKKSPAGSAIARLKAMPGQPLSEKLLSRLTGDDVLFHDVVELRRAVSTLESKIALLKRESNIARSRAQLETEYGKDPRPAQASSAQAKAEAESLEPLRATLAALLAAVQGQRAARGGDESLLRKAYEYVVLLGA